MCSYCSRLKNLWQTVRVSRSTELSVTTDDLLRTTFAGGQFLADLRRENKIGIRLDFAAPETNDTNLDVKTNSENCCFWVRFYRVRQLEKKRKIENLVDCPKKRKPVRASREKVLTEKIFLTDFLRFWAEFWGWKCAKRKQKVHFLTNSLVLKNCWNSDCLKIFAGIWVEQKIRQKLIEKIKKNKKEKRIFVKLRQFSTACQLTENVVSRICSLYHEIKTFGNEQAPRS